MSASSLEHARSGALTAAARALDRVLGGACEAAAAALVAAEVVILFAGVAFRYALDSPLTWSDELASTLFLWTVMLGAAVALRRGEHMRLELGRRRMGQGTREALRAARETTVAPPSDERARKP